MRSSSAVIFCLLVASALAAGSTKTKTKTTTTKGAATQAPKTSMAPKTQAPKSSTQAPKTQAPKSSTKSSTQAPKKSTQAPIVGCSPKTEAEMLKEIRVSLKCPDAAPTSCKCSGNGQKQFDCPGPEKTLWASTGKKCINATSDKDNTWAKHTWPYPANTADDCKGSSGTGANIEPGSYDCTKVKVTPATNPVTYKPHKFEQGYAGYNSQYNSEAWCTQPSCYVDPCTCNMTDFSASSWFKKQDGTKMYYSGMICGAKYEFKAALCSGKKTKSDCMADSGCKFTEAKTTTAAPATTTKAPAPTTKATTKAAATKAPATTKAAATTQAPATDAPTTQPATTKAATTQAATTKATNTNATSKATTAAPPAAKIKIAGALTMTVADPAAFLNDTTAQDGVREGIADAHSVAGLKVSMNHVVLSLTLVRRLAAHTNATKSVKVAYTITVPKPSASVEAAMKAKATSVTPAQLTTAIVAKVKAKGGKYATMDVKVTAMETPVVTQIAAPTTTAKDVETSSRASAHVLASVVLGLVGTVPFL